MKFGEQIREIRKSENLTQEQFAEKLHVTRQAVSNWENDKNLLDIEMLILISNEFHVSLDTLIKRDGQMNNVTEKIIRDGSETRRAVQRDFISYRRRTFAVRCASACHQRLIG